jgi:hypothetical protein
MVILSIREVVLLLLHTTHHLILTLGLPTFLTKT